MHRSCKLFTFLVLASMIISPGVLPAAAASEAAGTAGKPTLISPAPGEFVATDDPSFNWNLAANAVTYDLEVASTYTFGSHVFWFEGSIAAPPFSLPVPIPQGKWYWHVRGRDSSDLAGPWSSYRAFTVDTTAPPAPILAAPYPSEVVEGTPTFKWYAAAGAKYYQFESASDNLCSLNLITSAWLTTTSYKPSPVLATGTHYWHVRSKDKAGNMSDWSICPPVIVDAPIPGRPTLASPANGSKTDDLQPTLTWNAVDYAATYELQVDDAYTFKTPNFLQSAIPGPTTDIDVDFGKWYWRVRAVNEDLEPGPWSAYRNLTVVPIYDYFDADRAHWTDGPGATWTLGSGMITTPGLNNLAVASAYHTLQFSDVVLQARMKMDFNPSMPYNTMDNSYGLVVRGTPTFSPLGNYSDAYYFLVSNVRFSQGGDWAMFTIHKCMGGLGCGSITGNRWWGIKPLMKFANWNTLKVAATGPTMRFYINGTLVKTVSDPSVTSGYMGVMTRHQYTYPESTYVDWVNATGTTAIITSASVEAEAVPSIEAWLGPDGQLHITQGPENAVP